MYIYIQINHSIKALSTLYLFLNLRNVPWSYSSHPPLIPPVSSRNFWNISHLNQLLQIIKFLVVMSIFLVKCTFFFSTVLFISIIGAKNVNIWLCLYHNCCEKNIFLQDEISYMCLKYYQFTIAMMFERMIIITILTQNASNID